MSNNESLSAKTPIERLEEKIREAVPESIYKICPRCGDKLCSCKEIFNRKELIGRPLQLADLLIAIKKCDVDFSLLGNDMFLIHNPYRASDYTEFDLQKDLHQNLEGNPQLVSFLAEILL